MKINHVEEILQNRDTLVQLSASGPIEVGEFALRAQIRPIEVKGQKRYQLSLFQKTSCDSKNITEAELENTLLWFFERYNQLLVRFTNLELHFTRAASGSFKRKAKSKITPLSMEHNRVKKYLLQDGKPLDFLIALGIMGKDGKVLAKSYDKFVQINRFLEIIDHRIEGLDTAKELKIVDLGCGKAYLTFALYHHLQNKGFVQLRVEGIDRKRDTMTFCQQLTKNLGWSGLNFTVGSIEDFSPEGAVDMILALHACDTATDDALRLAIERKARYIFAAPCCQQEVSKQIQAKMLPALLNHGIFKQRFSALLTDALRVRLLELAGYTVTCIEFVDPEHTPKNLLIVAEKRDSQPNFSKLKEEYDELLQLFPAHIKFENGVQLKK